MRLFLLPLVMAGLAFSASLGGDFVWDDRLLILENPKLHGLTAIRSILTSDFWPADTRADGALELKGYYRPLISLLFALQYAAFGARPLFFHLTTLLAHLVTIALVVAWLQRRLGPVTQHAEAESGMAVTLAAALFAVHPSRVENAAWISGATDLLAAAGCLGAWLLFRDSASIPRVAAGILAWLAAFASKEVALVFPAILLADALLLSRGAERRSSMNAALALSAVAAAALLVRTRFVPLPSRLGQIDVKGLQRAVTTLGLYLERIAWPWPPTVHANPSQLAPGSSALALGVLAAIVLAVLALGAWRLPPLRPFLADSLWFVLPLAPVLNLFPLGTRSLTADRFLYLPLAGLSALVMRVYLLSPTSWRPRLRVLGLAALGGASVVCAWHSGHFANETALWTYEASLRPQDPLVLHNLGEAQWEAGDRSSALKTRLSALKFSAGTPQSLSDALAYVESRLALSSDADSEALESIRAFYDALADPLQSTVRLSLDGVSVETRPSDHSRARIAAHPAFSNNRAIATLRSGHIVEASAIFTSSCRRHPEHFELWVGLCRALALAGRLDHALREAANGSVRFPERVREVAAVATAIDRVRSAPGLPARAVAIARLGSPREGRRLLREMQLERPPSPEQVAATCQIDLLDRRPDLARANLAAARDRAPERDAEWDWIEKMIVSAERAR